MKKIKHESKEKTVVDTDELIDNTREIVEEEKQNELEVIKNKECSHHWFTANKLNLMRCNICGAEKKIKGEN